MKVWVTICKNCGDTDSVWVSAQKPSVICDGDEVHECNLSIPLIDEERAEYDKPARDFIRDVVIARASTIRAMSSNEGDSIDYEEIVNQAAEVWVLIKKLTTP